MGPDLGSMYRIRTHARTQVYIMMAELMLASKPPDPRAAMHKVCTAAGVKVATDIQDHSLRVLAAQCQSLMGAAKSEEASASAVSDATHMQHRGGGCKSPDSVVPSSSLAFHLPGPHVLFCALPCALHWWAGGGFCAAIAAGEYKMWEST